MPLEAGHEPELRALERRLAAHQPVTMEDLTLTLEWAVAGRLRVVLLLDEFKDLLERPAEFDEVFRGRLRSLYSDRTVALVLATRQPLSEIEGFSAYFANGISQYTIGVLMPGEAAQLLRQPHDRGFSADEVRMALAAGARHPLRLQWAGFWLYEWKGQRPGPLSQAHGTLHAAAERRLTQQVHQAYEQAMRLSRPLPVHVGSRTGWMTQVNRFIKWLGDAIDALKARFYAVLLLLALPMTLVFVLLHILGVFTYDQLKELLRRLFGGT